MRRLTRTEIILASLFIIIFVLFIWSALSALNYGTAKHEVFTGSNGMSVNAQVFASPTDEPSTAPVAADDSTTDSMPSDQPAAPAAARSADTPAQAADPAPAQNYGISAGAPTPTSKTSTDAASQPNSSTTAISVN